MTQYNKFQMLHKVALVISIIFHTFNCIFSFSPGHQYICPPFSQMSCFYWK